MDAQGQAGIQIRNPQGMGEELLQAPPRAVPSRLQTWNPSQRVIGSSSLDLLLICGGHCLSSRTHYGKSSLELFMPYDEMPRGGTKGGQRQEFQWLECSVCLCLLGMHFQSHSGLTWGMELWQTRLSWAVRPSMMHFTLTNQPEVCGSNMILRCKMSKQDSQWQ